MGFGENLKRIRLQHGLSQEELASRIGSSKQIISRCETGERKPNVSFVQMVAEEFGMSVDALLGNSEVNQSNSSPWRISEAIQRSGLSYGELSKATGIPKSALQRYATGETEKCPAYRLIAIADATGVSRSYLLGDDTAADAAAPVTQVSGGHQLSTFRGITITMAWQTDAPAHFQASYAGSSINISVDTLEVTEGSLPRKQQLMVLGWAALRQDQLMECWELASRQYAPYQIEPLR